MIDKKDSLNFAKKALHLVRINLPYLAELTHNIELVATEKIATAGIFASGRLIYNPEWFGNLSLDDATFIMAHEVMHLALNSHQRTDAANRELFNITHDFIINDLLKKTFKIYEVPADGLDWDKAYRNHYSLENKSAEDLMRFIKDALEDGAINKRIFRNHWKVNLTSEKPPVDNRLATQLKELFADETDDKDASDKKDIPSNSDVLTEELEIALFPNATNKTISAQKAVIKIQARKAWSNKLMLKKVDNIFGVNQRGGSSASNYRNYEILKGLYRPPWELALQQWLEGNIMEKRSYSRPSRRGSLNSDIIRPGKIRFGNTLHIILDVSGSQAKIQPFVLGKVHEFCEQMQIEQIHIIQCGTHITKDEWVYTTELSDYQIIGTGGGDLRPAMQKLNESADVANAIIVTDGYEKILTENIAYEVLWVLTVQNSHFKPGYGTVIQLRD